MIVLGNSLAASGRRQDAAAVFVKVHGSPAPSHTRGAALVGLAASDPDAARRLIPPALTGPDPRLQRAAVLAAGTAFGEGSSRELAALLPSLTPEVQVLVLPALDRAAAVQVADLLKSDHEAVRGEAIKTLGRIGNAASVPALLRASGASSREESSAALLALSQMSDPAVNAALTDAAAQGEPRSRAVAIEALAKRRVSSAAPALLRYAQESDAAVSAAACAALGELGSDDAILPLAQLTRKGTDGASEALRQVASRAGNKAEVERQLVGLLTGASAEGTAGLLEALGALGGPDALVAVVRLTRSSDDALKDGAIRALANWSDFAAAAPLLEIARDPQAKLVHSVLAIQGIVRLVKASPTAPLADRVDAALNALSAARRDQEKTLALSALGATPDKRAADALKPWLAQEAFKAAAAAAALDLAEAMLPNDRATARDLAAAVKQSGASGELAKRAGQILKQ
jgi:HEAT repeat protein